MSNFQIGDKVKTNYRYNDYNFFTAYPIECGTIIGINSKGTASIQVGSEVRELHYTWLEKLQ